MVNAAEHNKRIVQIGAQGRSKKSHRAVCQYIRNGQIGKVNHVEVWHENNWTGDWGEEITPPDYLDWDRWLGPARWHPYNTKIAPFNFRWMMDFGAGYVRRSLDELPRQGTAFPWVSSWNYAADAKMFRRGKVNDEHLRFT